MKCASQIPNFLVFWAYNNQPRLANNWAKVASTINVLQLLQHQTTQ